MVQKLGDYVLVTEFSPKNPNETTNYDAEKQKDAVEGLWGSCLCEGISPDNVTKQPQTEPPKKLRKWPRSWRIKRL